MCSVTASHSSSETVGTTSDKGFENLDAHQVWFRLIPLLSKEGNLRPKAQTGVICSKTKVPINRYCSSLNRPPQPSLREGIPA